MPERSNPFTETLHIGTFAPKGGVRVRSVSIDRGGPDEVFVPTDGEQSRRVRREWCGNGTYVHRLGWVGESPEDLLESMRRYYRELRVKALDDLRVSRERLRQIEDAARRYR